MRAIARRCQPHMIVAVVLALALCLGGTALSANTSRRAWAGEAEDAQKAVDDAQATLDDAEARMESLASDYDALKKQTDDMQARIDEIGEQALEAQQAVIAGREALGKTAVYEYVNGGSTRSLLFMVLEAQSFNDLLRNMTYLGSIMHYHADEVEAQKNRSAHLDRLITALNSQKNEQDKKLEELEAKRAEAESMLAEASSKLASAQSEQAARLEALMQMERASAAPVEVEGATTPQRQPVVPDGPVMGNSDQGSSSPDSGAGWSTGVASAYGGSSDPNTPNPGITANGSVCDDNSMGVAVPMAWSRYWQYYGRTVEISYNGQTVLATVNDCGGMGGGSRSLDLQPGVWKAFGYSSCYDWGLRTVSYRFL